MTKKWTGRNCDDCGAREGELHELGCSVERCPICGRQLIICGHVSQDADYKKLPFRVPYVRVLNICALCGEQWPKMFRVAHATWKKYVIPELQHTVLCRECYEELKRMFPKPSKSLKPPLNTQQHLLNSPKLNRTKIHTPSKQNSTLRIFLLKTKFLECEHGNERYMFRRASVSAC